MFALLFCQALVFLLDVRLYILFQCPEFLSKEGVMEQVLHKSFLLMSDAELEDTPHCKQVIYEKLTVVCAAWHRAVSKTPHFQKRLQQQLKSNMDLIRVRNNVISHCFFYFFYNEQEIMHYNYNYNTNN